jgi:hypothetical protein
MKVRYVHLRENNVVDRIGVTSPVLFLAMQTDEPGYHTVEPGVPVLLGWVYDPDTGEVSPPPEPEE